MKHEDQPILDLRGMPPAERHPKIFELFDALPPGEVLIIINDHDPRLLFYELKAERAETFDHERYEVSQKGPQKFVAKLVKR